MSVYTHGIPLLMQIETSDVRALLIQTAALVFDPDDIYVSELAPATYECDQPGYARETVTGAALTYDYVGNRVNLAIDSLNFGSINAGQLVDAVALYVHVTNDSDSLLIAHYMFDPLDTGDIDPFTVNMSGGILAYADETV